MNNCPKCGQEIPEEVQKCPNCGFEKAPVTQQEEAPRVRAVPNIPRRDPDSLPERPEGAGSSSGKGTTILLILAVLVILFLFFYLKK